ncbi:hypothetical protein PCE1_003403 [Barthelona sp. PCE]
MDEIVQQLGIALSENASKEEEKAALEYLDEIQTQEGFWRLAFENYSPDHDENLTFWLLQGIARSMEEELPTVDYDVREEARDMLIGLIQSFDDDTPLPYITKSAKALVHVVINMFLSGWDGAFNDLLEISQSSEVFLRLFIEFWTIFESDVVAYQYLTTSRDLIDRNTEVKRVLREAGTLDDVLDFFIAVITANIKNPTGQMVKRAMEAVYQLSGWIPIEKVYGEEFLAEVFDWLQYEELQFDTVRIMCCLLHRSKEDPQRKIAFLQSIDITNFVEQIFAASSDNFCVLSTEIFANCIDLQFEFVEFFKDLGVTCLTCFLNLPSNGAFNFEKLDSALERFSAYVRTVLLNLHSQVMEYEFSADVLTEQILDFVLFFRNPDNYNEFELDGSLSSYQYFRRKLEATVSEVFQTVNFDVAFQCYEGLCERVLADGNSGELCALYAITRPVTMSLTNSENKEERVMFISSLLSLEISSDDEVYTVVGAAWSKTFQYFLSYFKQYEIDAVPYLENCITLIKAGLPTLDTVMARFISLIDVNYDMYEQLFFMFTEIISHNTMINNHFKESELVDEDEGVCERKNSGLIKSLATILTLVKIDDFEEHVNAALIVENDFVETYKRISDFISKCTIPNPDVRGIIIPFEHMSEYVVNLVNIMIESYESADDEEMESLLSLRDAVKKLIEIFGKDMPLSIIKGFTNILKDIGTCVTARYSLMVLDCFLNKHLGPEFFDGYFSECYQELFEFACELFMENCDGNFLVPENIIGDDVRELIGLKRQFVATLVRFLREGVFDSVELDDNYFLYRMIEGVTENSCNTLRKQCLNGLRDLMTSSAEKGDSTFFDIVATTEVISSIFTIPFTKADKNTHSFTSICRMIADLFRTLYTCNNDVVQVIGQVMTELEEYSQMSAEMFCEYLADTKLYRKKCSTAIQRVYKSLMEERE